MDKLFGKAPTVKEQVRTNDRALTRQGRDLDRERLRLEKEEKKLTAEMKKMAKDGNQAGVRTLAKSLVQTRKQKDHLLQSKVTMNSVNSQMKAQAASHQMAKSMGQASQVMGKMNAQVSPAAIQKTMMEFQKQNEMMNTKEELISDALDGLDDEMDDEVDAEMGAILDSVGIDLQGKLSGVGSAKVPQRQEVQAEDDVGDLEAKLAQLRGS